MSRRRLAALGTLGAAALVAAGVAAAGHRAQTTQQAAAAFTATTVSHNRTTSCVASDGTYQNTTATYTGSTTSASDGRLSGTVVIRAHSIVNTATGNGWLDGSFRIRNGDGGSAHGTLHAAIGGGNAVGSVTGTVNRPQGKLVASFAAAFTQDGGFGNGALGSTGSAPGTGTIYTRGVCAKAKNAVKIAVFKLKLRPGEVVGTSAASKAGASGTLRLDVTRDSTGAITGTAQLTFRLTYRFADPVAISRLALYSGDKSTPAGTPVSDTGTTATNTSRGTIRTTVTGIPPSVAQGLLTDPQGYFVQLDTTGGALRDQLGTYKRK